MQRATRKRYPETVIGWTIAKEKPRKCVDLSLSLGKHTPKPASKRFLSNKANRPTGAAVVKQDRGELQGTTAWSLPLDNSPKHLTPAAGCHRIKDTTSCVPKSNQLFSWATTTSSWHLKYCNWKGPRVIYWFTNGSTMWAEVPMMLRTRQEQRGWSQWYTHTNTTHVHWTK